MKVFVYGTLKQGWGNHRLLEHSKFLGMRTTKDVYDLRNCGFPYAIRNPEEGRKVLGELYEIDEQTLVNLDRLEGHPHHYQRTDVELDGMDETVMMYTVEDTFRELPQCPTDPDGHFVWLGRD